MHNNFHIVMVCFHHEKTLSRFCIINTSIKIEKSEMVARKNNYTGKERTKQSCPCLKEIGVWFDLSLYLLLSTENFVNA